MDLEQLRHYCLNKKATIEAFPFDADTLVFKVKGKLFALIALKRWEAGEAAINLKADPEYAETLRAEYNSIRPGYHMNKKHWNTVHLHEGEVDVTFVTALIDHSYDMVVKGMSKKTQAELKSE